MGGETGHFFPKGLRFLVLQHVYRIEESHFTYPTTADHVSLVKSSNLAAIFRRPTCQESYC